MFWPAVTNIFTTVSLTIIGHAVIIIFSVISVTMLRHAVMTIFFTVSLTMIRHDVITIFITDFVASLLLLLFLLRFLFLGLDKL